MTVNKAPLTITASNGSMTYGGTAPTITPAYSGFVNGDSASSLTTQPTCSTDGDELEPGAPLAYPSSCSGAVDPNYTISYVGGHGDGEPGPADDHRLERIHDLRDQPAGDHADLLRLQER